MTKAGAGVATSVDERHKLLFSFLHETLGLPAGKASAEACALEHVLSAETTARLLRLVEEHRRLVRDGKRLRKGREAGRVHLGEAVAFSLRESTPGERGRGRKR